MEWFMPYHSTRLVDRLIEQCIRESQPQELTIDQIALQCEVSRSTVLRSLKRLESGKRVLIDRSYKPNRYEIPEGIAAQ